VKEEEGQVGLHAEAAAKESRKEEKIEIC